MFELELLLVTLMGLIQMYYGWKMYNRINYWGIIAFIIGGCILAVSAGTATLGVFNPYIGPNRTRLNFVIISALLSSTVGIYGLWKAVEKLQ